MISFSLSVEEKKALRISVKKCSRAHAIRILAILALSEGHSFALVANILDIDDDTVRRYLTLYQEKGLAGLL